MGTARLKRHVIAGLVGALAMACAAEPPPGYSGPLPSERAQTAIGTLIGATLQDEDKALGGGAWTIVAFGVVLNPVSEGGQGPVVLLERDGERRHLPMEADGDAADLYRRVRGSAPEGVSGETSAAYRRVLGLVRR